MTLTIRSFPVYFRPDRLDRSSCFFRKYIHHGVTWLPCCSHLEGKWFISFITLIIVCISFSEDWYVKQYHFERLVSIWIVWNVISWSHFEGTDASHTFKLRTLYSLKENKWTSICVLWYGHYSCLLLSRIFDLFLQKYLST